MNPESIERRKPQVQVRGWAGKRSGRGAEMEDMEA